MKILCVFMYSLAFINYHFILNSWSFGFEELQPLLNPLDFRLETMKIFSIKCCHATIPHFHIEPQAVLQFVQIDRTQVHRLVVVFFEVTTAVHAAVEVDAMTYAKQMAYLMN